MKLINKYLAVSCLLLPGIYNGSLKAQSTEAQQLLLNVEKLTQLKSILEDMKKGYQVISQGYTAIRDISQGNFSLHQVFLDGLLLVKPEIKNYYRVADIISSQKDILSEYRYAFDRFKKSGNFSEGEIRYLAAVYERLSEESKDNLDDLLMVVTSSKLRMSDDERLQMIDRIFEDTRDKLSFLRHFNQQTALLSNQRTKEKADIVHLQNQYQP